MIKQRNKLEFRYDDLSVPGTQSATTDKQCLVVPFTCTLKAIFAKLGTAGTTGSQIVDIKKNGTSIFNGATKLTFATGVQACTYDAFASTPVSFVKGDIITLDVTQIHTTPAKNLAVTIVLSRRHLTAPQTDTLGSDVDAII